MRIAISGTYSTGKTTTALALSFLTGITTTPAGTMREIVPTTFPGKRLEKCNFHELMELGMRRLSERIIAEQALGNEFISDGCPLQEWIYSTTRMKTGLNPSETIGQKEHKVGTMKDLLEDFGQSIFENIKLDNQTFERWGCVECKYFRKCMSCCPWDNLINSGNNERRCTKWKSLLEYRLMSQYKLYLKEPEIFEKTPFNVE